jgi:hypothetical protein
VEIMTGTFINQGQLDDIDACMTYMKHANAKAGEFLDTLGKGGKYPTASPPYSNIRAGEKQANLWDLSTSLASYRQSGALLIEAAHFTDYLLNRIAQLPPADQDLPVARLRGISPPRKLVPMFAATPLNDCLQVLRHYQQWVWALAQIMTLTERRRIEIREAIAETLPRIVEFMSEQIRLSGLQKPPPPLMDSARRHQQTVTAHYNLGMSSMANFLTQSTRIRSLLNETNVRFATLESASTLVDFISESELMLIYLNQTRRYAQEMADLRTVH